MREEFFTRLKQGFEGVWEAEGGSKWQKYCNNREEEEKEEGGGDLNSNKHGRKKQSEEIPLFSNLFDSPQKQEDQDERRQLDLHHLLPHRRTTEANEPRGAQISSNNLIEFLNAWVTPVLKSLVQYIYIYIKEGIWK